MDWTEQFVDLALGAVIGAPALLGLEHVKRRAIARLNDHNPFNEISANHDLTRAVRIAWVEAALEIVDASKMLSDTREWIAERGEIRRFGEIAHTRLIQERAKAFDRNKFPGKSPIDHSIRQVLVGVSEFIGTSRDTSSEDRVTCGFVSSLADLTGWPVHDVPTVFAQTAANGLTIAGGGPARSFGDLVFAAFAELIKNPKRYPEAREAFHIAMTDVARDLSESILEAVRGIDENVDALLETSDALDVMLSGLAGHVKMLPTIADGVGRIESKVDAQLNDLHDICRKIDIILASTHLRSRDMSEQFARKNIEAAGAETTSSDTKAIECAWSKSNVQIGQQDHFQEARHQALILCREGRFKEASASLMEELAREEKVEEERQRERQRRKLCLLDCAIGCDELAADAKAVARKLCLVAAIESGANLEMQANWLLNKANEYYERGDRAGERTALIIAVETYRVALEERSCRDI